MALGTHSVPHTQAGASVPSRGSSHAPRKPNPRPKRPPLTQGRISRLLQNPGTRAALADKYLPPAMLAQRQLNRRLNAPVTPGSTMTERDLSRQTRAASDVRYGYPEQQAQQGLQAAQQVQRDVGGYYDQYLRELAAHQQAVAQHDEDVRGPRRFRVTVCGKQISQEVTVPAAVVGDSLANRTRRVGVLSRGVEERATAVARLAGGFAVAVEEGEQPLARRLLRELGHGGPPELVLFLDVGPHQLILGLEVVVEGRFGHLGLRDDPVDPHGVDTLGVEEPGGGVEQAASSPARPATF